MKIKTITCHEVYNYGASLQEYALLEFLNKNGHQAQAIHYKPDYLSGHFKLNAVSNPRFNFPFVKQIYILAKLPFRLKALKRKKAFDVFTKKNIPTDTIFYKNNEELKVKIPEGDAFICGSDQIWNSFFPNGKDLAFYLNFVPTDKIKISYAASFAIDKLEEYIKPLVRENVSRLNAIGVRETSGVKILKELGINNAVQVLDPVFLLSAEHWKLKFINLIKDKFIFVYDFDSNPIIKEIALKLKKEEKVKIFTVNQNIDYADRNFFLHGPETFLSLIYYSKFNITNSFHALAFSIIFEKQLVIVNRSENINTRMKDLLNLFKLDNRLITSISEYYGLDSIDYTNVNHLKMSYIEKSKYFLLESLKENDNL